MNHLRTRRQARREIVHYTLLSVLFLFIGMGAAMGEFMLWYFCQIPLWLTVMTEALSFMLMICGGVIYESVEQERGRLHKIFD